MQSAWDEALLGFASDMSSGSAVIAEAVRGYLTTPPTGAAVGFVGVRDWPARARIFLATINQLDERRFISSIEDKSTWEILGQWQSDRVIDVEALPAIAKGVFAPLAKAQFSENPDE